VLGFGIMGSGWADVEDAGYWTVDDAVVVDDS